jgi:CBS domain-containing protein
MAPTVQTFMNPRLVYLREGDRLQVALRPLLDLGITAVPILDDDHKPVGIISLRDLVDKRGGPPHMKEDIRTIVATASIDDAAKMLVDTNLHHLIVIDDAGLAVGMLSALDVIRALVGAEPKHPTSIERVRAQGSEGGGAMDAGSGSGDAGGTKGG